MKVIPTGRWVRGLGVSWLTVRNHISRLLVKFEAKNRTDLLARLVALRRLRRRKLIL
ncbi:MAG TPA: hypothetical protein EYM43_05680 [Alphaproteobacteria bacterium]|nr:hypothetical protein [Alphaproteobacteria bacterium]